MGNSWKSWIVFRRNESNIYPSEKSSTLISDKNKLKLQRKHTISLAWVLHHVASVQLVSATSSKKDFWWLSFQPQNWWQRSMDCQDYHLCVVFNRKDGTVGGLWLFVSEVISGEETFFYYSFAVRLSYRNLWCRKNSCDRYLSSRARTSVIKSIDHQ